MKQNIIIPTDSYKMKNSYENILMPWSYSVPVVKGYFITPENQNFFKTLGQQKDIVAVLNFDNKKDPRRSKSTKQYNPLNISFDKIFEDQSFNCDLTINQPANSDTCFSVWMNQKTVEFEKNKNLTFTFNGAIRNLFIDRANPFENILICSNNTTDLLGSKEGYWTRNSSININDHNLKNLTLTYVEGLEQHSKPTYDINYLVSNSLSTIKIKSKKLCFGNTVDKFKVPNLQKLDISEVQEIDLRYNYTFLHFAQGTPGGKINPKLMIKVNPQTRIASTLFELPYDAKPEKYPTLKQYLNLKTDDPIEISFSTIMKLVKAKIDKKEKNDQNQYRGYYR